MYAVPTVPRCTVLDVRRCTAVPKVYRRCTEGVPTGTAAVPRYSSDFFFRPPGPSRASSGMGCDSRGHGGAARAPPWQLHSLVAPPEAAQRARRRVCVQPCPRPGPSVALTTPRQLYPLPRGVPWYAVGPPQKRLAVRRVAQTHTRSWGTRRRREMEASERRELRGARSGEWP